MVHSPMDKTEEQVVTSSPLPPRKQVFAAMFGNALEYYDVTLYGFFIALLTPLFHPSNDLRTQKLLAFSTFAAGFLMRPLGGLLFGHLGDRYGRRKALIVSMALVIIPTSVIGLLPPYEVIGITAAVILVACRLLQGLCVGGEYAGAAVFVVEHTYQKGSAGLWGAILTSSGAIGAWVASFMSALCTLPFIPSWGWRIPFLLGAVLGVIFLYARLSLEETPAFRALVESKKIARAPIWEVFKNHKRNFLAVIATGSVAITPLYMSITYFHYILAKELGVATWKTTIGNTLVMGCYGILLPLAGLLSDRWGTRLIMTIGAVSFLIPALLIVQFALSPTFGNVLLIQLLLTGAGSLFVGPSARFESTLFPPHERYSAIAFGYGLGGAIFGGTSPLFCTGLVRFFQDPRAVAIYVVFAAILGATAIILGRPLSFTPRMD